MTDLDRPVGRLADSVRIMELGDELSVFDAAAGSAHSLNRTAADVLAMVDGQSSLRELISTLAKAYEVDPKSIESDIRAVVEQLTAVGVIVPVP